ncbi:MAG: efflux RND transporter permease subunit [Armatimonadota bacterium]|nr:efflux RND transporter permease subunit [Armatimonadota bacterium]MDR7612203.1 efflux RND transporter permease subunit [Armatimonadota bacterium]
MSLAELSIRRPVAVLMVLSALLVLGLLAYARMPVELFPNVQFPFVTVATPYPGAGPEEVEALITRPIEEQVSSLTHVRRVISASREGSSVVGIEFVLGTNLDSAVAEVRQRVDLVKATLPRDAGAPTVRRFDVGSLPVVFLGLGGGVSGYELRRLAEEVVTPRLERVPGVAAVSVSGGRVREIRVEVSQDRLRALGLSVLDIQDALRRENLNVPSGAVRQGDREVLVRVTGEFRTVEDMAALPLPRPGASPVRLGDVAEIRDAVKDPDRLTRLDGRESVGLAVYTQADANTVTVADGVRRVVEELRPALPPGVSLVVARDDSVFIRESVADVQGNLLLGAALATAVVFLFLHNLRSTAVIALALPAAIVATYLPVYFAGFSLNVLSLLGLAIAIGLMVDNAIVVTENITRHLEEEVPPAEAARRGAREIELAVMASNLANVAVFLPIAFMRGLVGQFFRQFGLTVAFANLFSILIGFTLTPMLAARWLRPASRAGTPRWAAPFAWWDRAYGRLADRYRTLLAWALDHRAQVLAAAAALFAVSVLVVASPLVGKEFMPSGDSGQFQVDITMPPGASLSQTDRAAAAAERRLRRIPDVASVFTVVGGADTVLGVSEGGSQRAQILVSLIDRSRRSRSVDQVMADLRARIRDVPAAQIKVGAPGVTGGTAPVQVEVTGPDPQVLQRLADRIREIVASTPGTVNVDTTLRPGKTEVLVVLDRVRLAQFGLSTAEVGAQLRTSLAGTSITRFRADGTEYDITVRSEPADRESVARLGAIAVGRVGGAPVRLSDVAVLELRRGPVSIDRLNRQRLVTVTASLHGRPLGAVVDDIRARLTGVTVPPGYMVRFGGEAEFQREAFGDMLFALALGTVLVYMTIAAQFESLLSPLAIMASVPLAGVGVVAMLLLTRTTVSIMSLLGIVMLAGIVVNNAILLIEFVTQQRRQGVPRREALLQAARMRLRPILMTALVSVMGGLPVALGLGISGAEWRRPLGIAVLGGLATSTALTLVVIPVVYTLLDDLTLVVRRRAPAAAPAVHPVAGASGGEDSRP